MPVIERQDALHGDATSSVYILPFIQRIDDLYANRFVSPIQGHTNVEHRRACWA